MAEISEEEREARRQRAIELHAQGKFGGAEFGRLGGRPRKPSITEQVAEKLREKSSEVAAAIIDGLDEDNAPTVRLQAARQALEVEALDDRRRASEEREFERLSDPALAKLVGEMLSGLKDAGAIDQLFVDAEAEEISDAEVVGGEAA